MIDPQLRAIMAPEIIAANGGPEAALRKALAMARQAAARLAELQFAQHEPACSTTRVRRLVETEEAACDLCSAMSVLDILAGDALDQLAEVGGDITKLGGFS